MLSLVRISPRTDCKDKKNYLIDKTFKDDLSQKKHGTVPMLQQSDDNERFVVPSIASLYLASLRFALQDLRFRYLIAKV